VASGLTVVEPLRLSVPLQPPLAVQLVALVDAQFSVLLCPCVMVVGLAASVSVGAGVAPVVMSKSALTPLMVSVAAVVVA
jgi:hypothetical protein